MKIATILAMLSLFWKKSISSNRSDMVVLGAQTSNQAPSVDINAYLCKHVQQIIY